MLFWPRHTFALTGAQNHTHEIGLLLLLLCCFVLKKLVIVSSPCVHHCHFSQWNRLPDNIMGSFFLFLSLVEMNSYRLVSHLIYLGHLSFIYKAALCGYSYNLILVAI